MHLVYQDHLVKRVETDSRVPLDYMEPRAKKVPLVKQDLQAKKEFLERKVLPAKKVIKVRLVNLESRVIRGHKLWVQWLLQLTTIMVDLEIPSLQINS